MKPEERSRDVYEHISAYTQAPLVPLPAPGDLSTLEQIGVVPGKGTDRLVSTVLRVTGYRNFESQLPGRVESLLRKHNLRLPGVFAPVISATLVLADDPRALTPVERAATLIIASRGLYYDIFSGRLPADAFGGEPLEMGQYPNVFATNLIVGQRGISVFKSTKQDQLQLMIGGRLYAMELCNQGIDMRVEELVEALDAAIAQGEARPLTEGEVPVGMITGATPATQRAAFAALRRSEDSSRSLERTKHALMTVCFDLECSPGDEAEVAMMAHARHPENRWFHSSLQLVVFGNGKAAAVCNFSTYLDGNTMMRVGSEIQRRAANIGLGRHLSRSSVPVATELAFQATPDLMRISSRARDDWRSVADTQQATFSIENAGRHQLCGAGVEPVPAFITALAMTGRQLTGQHASVAQFLTMSRYRCMDMVSGVVTTSEVQACVDALLQGAGSRDEQREMLVRAVASQQAAARKLRRCLPLAVAINLYIREQTRVRKGVAIAGWLFTGLALKSTGRLKSGQREIVVSHPEIYPEVPVIGRPGVRIPYAKYFGLHYQIWEDKTVITMMPGMQWTIANAALIANLEQNIKRVRDLLEQPGG